jgi:hypothetical protein
MILKSIWSDLFKRKINCRRLKRKNMAENECRKDILNKFDNEGW